MQSLHNGLYHSLRGRSGRRPSTRRVSVERLEGRTLLTGVFGNALSLGGPLDADRATSVAADAAGNVYVAGSFAGNVDFDPGPAVFNLTSTGSADGFLAKYSPAGALLWAGAIANAGEFNSNRSGLALGPGGDVYLTGGFSGTSDFDLGPGVSALTAGAPNAGFVARYTPGGGLVWARGFGGGTSFVHGIAIAVDPAGNVYSAGSMGNGTADLDPGPGTFTLTNTGANSDTYLSKLDPAGNFLWAGKFTSNPGTGSTVGPADIAVDAFQNLYVTGVYVGTVDFDPGAGTASKSTLGPASNPSSNGYVAKVTPAGGLGYFVSVGAITGRDDGFGVAVDGAGNAYVAGEIVGASSVFQADGTVAATLTSSGGFDAYAMKLTPSGSLAWATEWGSTGLDEAMEIAYNGSDAIYLTGGYMGTVNFGPGTSLSSAGSSDAFVMRLGTDGSFGWAAGMGGANLDLGLDVAANGAGDVFTSGRFAGTADFDPGAGTFNLTSAGNTDGFLSKLTETMADRAPVAANDAYATDEDTPVTVAAPGLLGNDTDPDGDPLTATLVSGPAHGTLALNSDGALTYTPLPNFNGNDFFTYRDSDGVLTSNVASVTVTVRPVNDAPVAAADAYSTDEDTPLTVAAPGVLGNDGDVDGDPLTALLVSGPAHGTLTLNSDGAFTYSPALNFNGTDTFTYRASDGSLTSGAATVFLTVRPVNDAPVARDDAYSTDEDTPVTVPAPGVLGNDSDVDSASVTAILVSGPAHGTLALNSNGSLTYTPLPDFNGTDFFIYRDSDGSLTSNVAAVTITVRPVNDAPAAANQTFTVPENSPNGTPVGVFHASDVDGDALTYALVSGNTGGAFAIDSATGRIRVANGSLLDFETRPQYALTVTATDPSGLAAQATATINLTDVAETIPVAIDIKPGESPNTINIKSNGKIEVAIFSSPTFDARRIDVGSLRFGRTGTEDSLSRTPHGDPRFRYEDLNGDGRLDLIAQFETERTGFVVGDVLGRLNGQTLDGQLFVGSDMVLIKRPGN